MDQLRKIIQEAISQVIEEDYTSAKEINELANQTLVWAAKKNLEYVLRQMASGENSPHIYPIHLYPVKLLDVYQENPKKYPTLGNFLTNSNIMVQFVRANDTGVKGDYGWVDDTEFDTTSLKTIRLFYGEKFDADIKSKAEDVKTYHKKEKMDDKDLYFTFWYAFVSTLEHEIQHVYDDYRSNTKLYRTKQFDKYKQKYHLPTGAEIKINDPEQINKRHQDYLRLQHEIWARFTQTINNPKFRMTKLDFAKTKDGIDYLKYEMLPIDEVVKNFKREFVGWNVMSDKIKRTLISRVVQYWHKEQDKLSDKNKESIEREIKAKKDKEVVHELKQIKNQIKDAIQNKR